MKKAKSLNFVIPLVVYPFDILVSIGQSDDSFRKTLTEHLPPSCLPDLDSDPIILSLGEAIQARTINFSTGHQTVIRMKNFPNSPEGYGILSHEIFHACSYILWRMGINLEIEKTEEVYGYLIQYVTQEIHDKL
jgi:hypothetical protein